MRSCILAVPLLAALALSTARAENYHGRKTWKLQNDKVQVLVAPGGGHIASFTLRKGPGAGVNPLWLPPWKSLEPGGWTSDPAAYGGKPAAQLLCSILGHNICVDFFGSPSKAETAAGIPVHGEAPCVNWSSSALSADRVTYSANLPLAQMKVTRSIRLTPGASTMWITETVENLSPFDRPFGWQQHVTLGAPFLKQGETAFDQAGGWSTVYPKEFSKQERYKRGETFGWPDAPGKNGDTIDWRAYPASAKNSDFTVTLADPNRSPWSWFTCVNTKKRVVIGYIWRAKDFPWTANWEENHARTGKPWLGKAVARGIEFGTSPFPDSRRDNMTLSKLHDVDTYRWIDAKGKQTISYGAFILPVPAGTSGVNGVEMRDGSIAVKLAGVEKTITLPLKR